MSLLGNAALLLSFDVAPEAIIKHDDWHSHEHFTERLSVPGFLRGSRWVSSSGQPRYFVMYEVADLATLSSPAYLERLNHPSAWSARMFPHYRGMKRGLCRVSCSYGAGLGHAGLLLRFATDPEQQADLREWLSDELLPALPSRAGLVSGHLFESAAKADFTQEQAIRGKDAAVDWVVLVTGYERSSVEALAADELSVQGLERRGASGVATGIYEMRHSLSADEVAAGRLGASSS